MPLATCEWSGHSTLLPPSRAYPSKYESQIQIEFIESTRWGIRATFHRIHSPNGPRSEQYGSQCGKPPLNFPIFCRVSLSLHEAFISSQSEWHAKSKQRSQEKFIFTRIFSRFGSSFFVSSLSLDFISSSLVHRCYVCPRRPLETLIDRMFECVFLLLLCFAGSGSGFYLLPDAIQRAHTHAQRTFDQSSIATRSHLFYFIFFHLPFTHSLVL